MPVKFEVLGVPVGMGEIWKPVKGFENEYEVSNFGRVKSLDTIQRRSNGRVKNILYGRKWKYVD